MIKDFNFKTELNLMLGVYELFDGLKNKEVSLTLGSHKLSYGGTFKDVDYYYYDGVKLKINEVIYKLIYDGLDKEIINHNNFPDGFKNKIKQILWKRQNSESNNGLQVYYADDRNNLMGVPTVN